jgi:hypothetical protein
MNWRRSSGVDRWGSASLTDRDFVLRSFGFRFEQPSRGWAYRQADLCPATLALKPVGDLKDAAVSFAYLPGEREANATASRLGGVEGHK